MRASEWEGQNARIETIVDAKIADRILAHLEAHYFEHVAVIGYMQTVTVVRGEKYA